LTAKIFFAEITIYFLIVIFTPPISLETGGEFLPYFKISKRTKLNLL